MSNIARRGFNYKQTLARATHVIEIRQNRVIDGVVRYTINYNPSFYLFSILLIYISRMINKKHFTLLVFCINFKHEIYWLSQKNKFVGFRYKRHILWAKPQ